MDGVPSLPLVIKMAFNLPHTTCLSYQWFASKSSVLVQP